MSFILVVDGDPAAAQEIAEILAGVGLEARTETSGEEALALATASRPQAIILDGALIGRRLAATKCFES